MRAISECDEDEVGVIRPLLPPSLPRVDSESVQRDSRPHTPARQPRSSAIACHPLSPLLTGHLLFFNRPIRPTRTFILRPRQMLKPMRQQNRTERALWAPAPRYRKRLRRRQKASVFADPEEVGNWMLLVRSHFRVSRYPSHLMRQHYRVREDALSRIRISSRYTLLFELPSPLSSVLTRFARERSKRAEYTRQSCVGPLRRRCQVGVV